MMDLVHLAISSSGAILNKIFVYLILAGSPGLDI
jgi:hypothetical protein